MSNNLSLSRKGDGEEGCCTLIINRSLLVRCKDSRHADVAGDIMPKLSFAETMIVGSRLINVIKVLFIKWRGILSCTIL
jgi:hypothetical protein